MSNKQNDFIAAVLYQPEASLEELYANGITPENTGIKERDDYKNIKAVQEIFTNKEGKFDEKSFNAFYDSALRVFNEYQNEDYTKKAIELIETSPLDWTNLNGKKYDAGAIVHIEHLPNKYTMGLGNIWEIGTPTFSDAEIAQSKKVLDENGKELDYTPNDKRGGFFKGVLRKPMALAIWEEKGTHLENGIEVEHKKGDLKLDDEGDARYQLLGDKSSAGRQMLRYWDTVTVEGKWANKYDFMDSDGLRKSAAGVVAKTAFQIIPYFIPYVGPVYKYLMAAKELSTAMPIFLNSINTAFGGSEDSDFGKAMNSWSNTMETFKPGMSQYGQSKFFSFENIGNIVATTVGQLYQQKAIGNIPKILKQTGKTAKKIGRQASLAYMALTSGQDAYNSFKEAGASDQTAGIGALASMGALYGLMNIDYFEEWLFKGTWLDENRVLNETLKETLQNKRNAWGYIKEGGEKFTKTKAQQIFNDVKGAVGERWNKMFTVAGTTGKTLSQITGRSMNEAIEETMEEISTDLVKGLFLGMESLGVDMTGTNDLLNFDFSPENLATRYGGAFVGGAIGGAIFEGIDRIEHWSSGSKSLIDLDTKNRLMWFLRNGYGKQIREEIDRLYKKGKLGNKNLSATKSVKLADVTESGDGNIVTAFQAGTENDNQNLMVYKAMLSEIDALEHFLTSNNFRLSDKELLAKMFRIQTDKEYRENLDKNLENPLISKIIELGLVDSVTNDVQYLLSQLDDKSIQIARKERELNNSIPDSTNKKSIIDSNQELLNLRTEYNSIKQVIDEILAGEHSDYYVEYGLALADGEFNKYFTPGDDSIAYSEIANYYWLNTGKQFDSLSEEEKNKIRVEYDSFKSLSDYSAQRQRFELFRNVNQRYSDIITKSDEELKNAQYDPEFSSEIYGNLNERIDKTNSRISEIESELEHIESEDVRNSRELELSRLKANLQVYQMLSKDASLERVRIRAANIPSISKYEYIQTVTNDKLQKINELREQIVNQGETPDITVIANLTSQIEENASEIERLNGELINLREQVKAEVLGYYSDMVTQKVVKFDNDVILKTVVPYLIETKLSDKQLTQNVLNNGEIAHHIDDYRKFITNVINNPFGFNDYYNDLIERLTKESEEFDIPESTVKTVVSKMLNGLDIELLEFLNQIKAYKNQLPKTPLTKMVQDLHVQIAGKPLQILEMLNMEKERYVAAKRVDEYILSHSDQQAKEIDNAIKLLDLITASVDAASNGYNHEANYFRTGDKKVKLADINDITAEIYKNEINTLKQRLEYLKNLSSRNNAAQSKKQFDIMLNVEPKLVASLLRRKDEINKEFGIDIEKIWNDSKGDVSLDGLTLETHPAFKDAKIEFEKNVFAELNGKFSKKQIAEKIFNVFKSDPNLWTCKAGEFNDSMNEFSPYVEMMYLTSFTTSNTYDFSCKWNEKVLNDKYYSEKYTPFYSQEFTVRCVWSQMKNGEVYNELLNLLKTQVPEDSDESKYLEELFTAENIVFVTGGPGTGKSSAVGLAIKLLAEAENGKVLGIAKFEQQVGGLRENLQVHEAESILFSDFESEILDNPINAYDDDASRKGHVSRLNDVDLSKSLEELENVIGPKILIVDEFTFFTEGEIQLLSKYANKHNILVVGLGDPKQNQVTISQSGKSAQTGFEDTVMFMTPALTVSMRVGNAAQELNNTKLDTILSKCVDYTKDHRDVGVDKWNEGMKSEGIIPKSFEFAYSDDSDGFFGTVFQTHTLDSKLDTVKNWIQKLKASGKTVALITDDEDFNSLESSVDKIIDPFNVQGAEFDYVIIAKKGWETTKLGDSNNEFLFLRDLLTMTSRAKIGSVILADEKQTPFKDLVSITSAPKPGGKIIVNSETDSRFIEIKQKYNDYIKGIYAKYVNELETSDDKFGEDVTPTSDDQTEEVLPMNDDDASEVPPTEDVGLQTVLDAYENELTDESVKYVRKSDYKKYQDRKAELAEGGFAHADTDQFVTYLYDGTIDLFKKGSLLEGLSIDFEDESGKEFLQSYREYLQAVSSIIMYRPKDAQLTKAIEFANSKLDSSELFITEYLGKVEEVLRNIDDTGYFYVTELDTDKQLVYYVTEDLYLPLNVIDKMTPGLYKNIKFGESIGVIGLSSNGTLHNDIKETNSNHVYQSSQGGIFAPDDNTRRELRNDNEDFNLANVGKSAIYVTYKPWLTPNEVFRFNVNEIGIRDYTISHQHEVKLIDIQKRIDFQTFIELSKHRKFVLRGAQYLDPNSDADTDKSADIDKSIDFLGKFLNLSNSDLSLLRNKPADINSEEYKKWTEAAYGSTQILTNQSLNHLISVLINYYLLQNNENSDKVLSNILDYIKSVGGYVSKTNLHKYNTKGFSIRLYKNADGRPNHSYYDDFFFEHLGSGEYSVVKNTWDDDIKDGEYYNVNKDNSNFNLNLDINSPIDFFIQALNTVYKTYSDNNDKPRLVELTDEITQESFTKNLAEHNFSIILGTKSDTYESELIIGELPFGNKVSTAVWPMIDFDVVGELLKGIDLNNTTDLENYFKNDSMFKNNFYVSMKGGEYYSVENGMNNFKVSAHKKLSLSKNISSDYVKFIAPLFRVNDYDIITDESERSKFKYLDLEVEKIKESVNTEPTLYTSSAFKITGNSKTIKIDNGVTSMLATVVAMTDSEMWIDCPLFKQPMPIKGEWKRKVPKPIMNREFAFKVDDLYFFKESNGLFVSSDSTSGIKNNWVPLNGGLFNLDTDAFIGEKDLPIQVSRFGLHVSDNLKIDQNGNVIDGEITIDSRFAPLMISGLGTYKSIKVTKLNFVTGQVTLKADGELVERFVIDLVSDLKQFFGLTDSHFTKSNAFTDIELFKNKAKRLLSTHVLSEYSDLIMSLIGEDIDSSLLQINQFLNDIRLEVGAEYSMIWDKNKVKIGKIDTYETIVAKLLNQQKTIFKSITVTNTDGDINICDLIEFSVTLSNDSVQTGFVTRKNGQWELKLQIESESADVNIETLIFETLNPETDGLLISQLMQIINEIKETGTSDTYNDSVDMLLNDQRLDSIMDAIDQLLMRDDNCNIIK